MGVQERLQEVVAPVCADLDVELVDLEHASGLVRVTIDRSGGVDLDTLVRVNRELSRELDRHDPIPGRYRLEVSSPGLERPLRTPEHFSRAVGAKVRIKTAPGVEGERRVEGVLRSADHRGITVEVGDRDPAARQLAYDEIERARTVFEWGPAPKPGGPRPRRARAGASPVARSGADGSSDKAVKA